MTKKKSTLFQVLLLLGVCGVVIGILMLMGCSNNNELGKSTALEAVSFDGDEYFATSDAINITNQEAFDLMVEAPEAIFALLTLVDEVMLRGNFEIDHDSVDTIIENVEENVEDFDDWMIEQGFADISEFTRAVELEELRRAAVAHLIEVTDEEVEESLEMFFEGGGAYFEGIEGEMYNWLFSQAVGEVSGTEMARLRYTANFAIYNEILKEAYEQYLAMAQVDMDDILEVAQQDSSDVIATINGIDITIGQLFQSLARNGGLQLVFGLLDPIILAQNFEVDPIEVEEFIDELRKEAGDDFDEIAASIGLESEDEIFGHFEAMLLNRAFNEQFTPDEERLRELHVQMDPTVSGSHILVDSYEKAADLIAQLQDASDISELFSELATEYSSCPSSGNGGDLGSWERGNMAEPFDDAIFALEVGEFTQTPVETDFGFHVIYKTGEEDIPEFEDVREQLEAQEFSYLQQTGVIEQSRMNFRYEAGLIFFDSMLQDRFEVLLSAD